MNAKGWLNDDTQAELNGRSRSVERFVGRESRPEIGDRFVRGDRALKIVDISATRVWMLETRMGGGEEYHWFLQDKYPEAVEKTMATKGTEFIPANAASDLSRPSVDSTSTQDPTGRD
jgi:hypothetical protein